MEEEVVVMAVRNLVRKTRRNLVRRTRRNLVRRTRVAQRRNLVRRTRVAQRAVMLARKAAAVGLAGLTHPSRAAPLLLLLQGMFIRFGDVILCIFLLYCKYLI